VSNRLTDRCRAHLCTSAERLFSTEAQRRYHAEPRDRDARTPGHAYLAFALRDVLCDGVTTQKIARFASPSGTVTPKRSLNRHRELERVQRIETEARAEQRRSSTMSASVPPAQIELFQQRAFDLGFELRLNPISTVLNSYTLYDSGHQRPTIAHAVHIGAIAEHEPIGARG